MNLTYFQLPTHLKNQLLPVYLIAGHELLLIQETKDAIYQKAHAQGFLENRRYEINKDFTWAELIRCISTPSLFSDRSYIELKMNQKLLANDAKILTQLIEKPNPDNLLVLLIEKLDSHIKKSLWFQSIEKIGGIISIWPLEEAQFKQWIKQKLRQEQLCADQFVIEYLALQNEGNLLAAAQEIEKLKLLFPSGKISQTELENCVTDNSRYDIFAFIDTCFEGNLSKIIKILYKLRDEGAEPTLILWAFTREIRKLNQLFQDIHQNMPWERITKKHQIWQKRQSLYKRLIKLHTPESMQNLLLRAERIDRTIKGLLPGNVWNDFELLAIQLSGHPFPLLNVQIK